MATSNAGQYGAAAVYYGGSAAPFTVWPFALGGTVNGINAFLLGKSTYLGLPIRATAVYTNASSPFASRLSGGGGVVPCRLGPLVAFMDTQGPYGQIY